MATITIELYPKIVVTVDTSKTKERVEEVLDAFFDDAETTILGIFATEGGVTVTRWHQHRSTGVIDKDENR